MHMHAHMLLCPNGGALARPIANCQHTPRRRPLQVAGEAQTQPDHTNSLRVVPLFETLGDLQASGDVMTTLFANEWCAPTHPPTAPHNHD